MTFAFLESVTFAFYVHGRTMMENPIENGGGYHMISKDISPFAKGFIGCKNCGCFLVSSRNELEKAVRTGIIEG